MATWKDRWKAQPAGSTATPAAQPARAKAAEPTKKPTGDPFYRADRPDGKARWIPKRRGRWLKGDR